MATFESTYGNGISVTGPWTGKLSNQSDRITVRNETDLRVDEVTYADEGDWAVRHRIIDAGAPGWAWADDHDGGGKSLELINRSQLNDVGQNWTASAIDKGTPGARNSVDATSSAPFILDLTHSPAIPHSDESVVVSASIVSDDAPAAVRLTTIVNGQTSVLTMRDDGLNGDQFAGDSVFSAQVAPQNDLTVVEFFVTAIGGDDASRRWPADVRNGEGDSANALYQVIDAFELRSIDELQ